MTVGVKDHKLIKPYFRFLIVYLISPRGPNLKESYQSRFNVIPVHAMKRGAYRAGDGSTPVLFVHFRDCLRC